MLRSVARARAMCGWREGARSGSLVSAVSGKRDALAFERDYTALLFSLSIAVRCGLDPLQALLLSEELFDERSIMRRELRALRNRVERGDPEDVAVGAFGECIRHPDLPLFRNAFLLARKHGGALSDSIHRLARVTRQRQSFRRKSRAALAGQRLSAYGIAGSATAIALLQAAANRAALRVALDHPVGRVALTVALSISVLGFCGMLWSSRIRV